MKDEKGDGSGKGPHLTLSAPKSVPSSPDAIGDKMKDLALLHEYLDETGWEDDEQVLQFYRLRAELYSE